MNFCLVSVFPTESSTHSKHQVNFMPPDGLFGFKIFFYPSEFFKNNKSCAKTSRFFFFFEAHICFLFWLFLFPFLSSLVQYFLQELLATYKFIYSLNNKIGDNKKKTNMEECSWLHQR